MTARLTLVVLAAAVVLAGCGYRDDNPRAVHVVAQAYLNALLRHDPVAACRVMAPEVQAAIAGGGTCEANLAAHWRSRYPRLHAGLVSEVPGPPGNPRFEIKVAAAPSGAITLGRYGSIWRVIDGGGLLQ